MNNTLSATLAALAMCAACAGTAAQGTPDGLEAAPRVSTEGGLSVRSADGRKELVLEGLLQTVVTVTSGERQPGSNVALKRVRPELAGSLDSLRFRLEPNFTEHEVELEEAWLGFDTLGGDARVMLGRMKVPFNLEEVRSRRHIDFPRFSIINQFAPAEDHGLFLNAMSRSGRWEMGLAATNGTGGSDSTSSKDVAARLMWHPFTHAPSSPWHRLQIGLAGTLGTQDEIVGGGSIDNALGQPVLTFAEGVALDGTRSRLGWEGAWFHGPWFVQAEAIALSQEMSADDEPRAVSLTGAYLTVSRALTGEDKTFGGVRPDAPFDFLHGSGRGAWVLACRVSQLDMDGALAAFAEDGPGPGRVRTLSLGLNWIPNEHAVLRNALVFSDYDQALSLDGAEEGSELALLIEFQLHF